MVSTAHDNINSMDHQNESAHEHAHTHEHKHVHTHEHSDSSDTHDHLQQLNADTGHDHNHYGQNDDEKETYALIKYMLSHNKHHAGELGELSAKLDAIGKSEAALLIAKAVSWFEKGNLELEKVVRLID